MDPPADNARAYNRRDLATQANPEACVTARVHLDWTLDFDRRIVAGSCVHTMRVVVGGTETADFDSSELVVEGVEVNGARTPYCRLAPPDPVLGSKISVTIPEALRAAGSEFDVAFRYRTSKKAAAVHWLRPEHTAGGQRPFVFTQSQAILARSLFPCQDSPGVKFPYTAAVSVPQWCTALMSALEDEDVPAAARRPGRFHFRQPVPVPAYLVALAAGELDFRDVSRRVRIWGEPGAVEAAAEEFGQVEDLLQAAEVLLACPYRWTRFDVLCMPPSFPYGGMENPCLTFATPTLLAGDKSLADVVAHEVAHSWTGNLVTHATWEHFWLNEGWTVWLERRIVARVRNNDDHLKLAAQVGWNHLRDDVARLTDNNGDANANTDTDRDDNGRDGRGPAPFTRLVWPLRRGEDPDEAFSSVPYEKGFSLLLHLEGLVGRDAFRSFAGAYIDRFKFCCLTSGDFVDFFNEYFLDDRPPPATPPPPLPPTGTLSTDEYEGDGTQFLSGDATPTANRPARLPPTPVRNVPPPAVSVRHLSRDALGLGRGSSSGSSSSGSSSDTGSDAFDLEDYLARTRKCVAAVDWSTWMHAPGLPPTEPDHTNALMMAAQVLARRWGTVADRLRGANTHSDLTVIFSKDDMKGWTTLQVGQFLEMLLARVEENGVPMCDAALLALDAKYAFSDATNAEIKFRWQQLCLRSDVPWIVPNVGTSWTASICAFFCRFFTFCFVTVQWRFWVPKGA